jgi:predicted Rossmann fold nucleotide-binding protein DprA/Smf involved in DNA uptake
LINGIEQKDVITITKESPDYPTAWKKLKGAPETLYCVGDTSLLQTRTLCVVGSRRTQESVIKLGMQISKDLSYAFTLVTGTADGGDSAVLEGALLGSGRVICVLAGFFLLR